MNIIGHKKIRNFLDRCIEKNMIAHAYLFLGPSAVGKRTLALEFAQKLTGSETSLDLDLMIIEPETVEKKGVVKKLPVKVGRIREVERFLSLSSVGKRRLAVIDNADVLTHSAQNALLKTLEEPPEKAVIILVSSRPNFLLPTIFSRCQTIRFGLVPGEILEKMIPAERNEKSELLSWSAGRPGILKKLLEDKEFFDSKKMIEKDFQSVFSGNVSERFRQAEELAKNVPELIERMRDWAVILRLFLISGTGTFPFSRSGASRLIEKIGQSIETLEETNANARLVLEDLFLEIEK